MNLTPEQKSELVYAFLKKGVPPTAVASVLELDPDHVRGALNHMRVESYGTDEIGEAMTFLIWEAYEEALYQVRYGSPASKKDFIKMVLARSVALAGRADTDTAEKIRAELFKMAGDMAPTVRLGESIYTPTE